MMANITSEILGSSKISLQIEKIPKWEQGQQPIYKILEMSLQTPLPFDNDPILDIFNNNKKDFLQQIPVNYKPFGFHKKRNINCEQLINDFENNNINKYILMYLACYYKHNIVWVDKDKGEIVECVKYPEEKKVMIVASLKETPSLIIEGYTDVDTFILSSKYKKTKKTEKLK